MDNKKEWKEQKKLFNEEIGKNLKKYISDYGMTQMELGAKIQVSQPTVTSWATGKNAIDLFSTYNVCKILNISFEDLLGSYFIPKEGNKNKLKLSDEEIDKLKRLIENVN